MAKEEFEVTLKSITHSQNFLAKDIPTKSSSYIYRGVDDEGIVYSLSITGPEALVSKKFVAFPLAKNIVHTITLESTQKTITTALNAALSKKSNPKKQKNLDDINLDDIDKEIDQLGATKETEETETES